MRGASGCSPTPRHSTVDREEGAAGPKSPGITCKDVKPPHHPKPALAAKAQHFQVDIAKPPDGRGQKPRCAGERTPVPGSPCAGRVLQATTPPLPPPLPGPPLFPNPLQSTSCLGRAAARKTHAPAPAPTLSLAGPLALALRQLPNATTALVCSMNFQ